jgi:hypothetical protein
MHAKWNFSHWIHWTFTLELYMCANIHQTMKSMLDWFVWLIFLCPAQKSWKAAKFRPIYSAPRAFAQRGIFLCHTWCDTGPRFFWSHLKNRPIYSPPTAHQGMPRTYSYPDPHRTLLSHPSWHAWGCCMKTHFSSVTIHFKLLKILTVWCNISNIIGLLQLYSTATSLNSIFSKKYL